MSAGNLWVVISGWVKWWRATAGEVHCLRLSHYSGVLIRRQERSARSSQCGFCLSLWSVDDEWLGLSLTTVHTSESVWVLSTSSNLVQEAAGKISTESVFYLTWRVWIRVGQKIQGADWERDLREKKRHQATSLWIHHTTILFTTSILLFSSFHSVNKFSSCTLMWTADINPFTTWINGKALAKLVPLSRRGIYLRGTLTFSLQESEMLFISCYFISH